MMPCIDIKIMYTGNTIKINDVSLASALLTMGASLDKETPYYKYQSEKGTTLMFFFEDTEDTEELVDIWNNPSIDNTHPIALMKVFNMNRIGITKEIKDAPGLVEVKKNGKTVLMSSDCSEEQKAKLLSKL
jgi:hypothetical protein